MPIQFDNTYAQLPDAFFAKGDPTPVKAPKWIAFNRQLSDELGLDTDALDSDQGLGYFSGNEVPPGADPISQAYSGHQFGGFNPQLGDGRAVLLGEVVDGKGSRRDIQLKGSGPTPFSRRGDGRSALGPVLREYLVSEAMYALGVPTTRALAAVWTGERVTRETMEPGGVFTRVASSHLRIGTTEFFAARQDVDSLRLLVEHALNRHYPETVDTKNPAIQLLENVCGKQAQLIAKWMGIGFIHGVMNTDNMTLSGETIDFGPCAFLDSYDPEKKFSYIDQNGRYAYINQPVIGQWNLTRLAEALMPLLIEEFGGSQDKAIEKAEGILEAYVGEFESARDKVFAHKLGFQEASDATRGLVEQLLALMHNGEMDFTITFNLLSSAAEDDSQWLELFPESEASVAEEWLALWNAALADVDISSSQASQMMSSSNPVVIPRNHRIEEVIQAGNREDFEPFHKMLEAITHPYEERAEFADYTLPPKEGEEVKCTFCGT